MQPETRYARLDGDRIAYQVLGSGPPDLVLARRSYSHIDIAWEDPGTTLFLRRLASFCRLILFDRRGTGPSDSLPHDPLPPWESYAEELAVVLDEVGSQRAAIMAQLDAGPTALLHGFEWTGHDDFAGKNVLSIALEVPNDMLGAGPMIGGWATISLHRDGMLVQMDRGGHPTINPFLNPESEKDLYNSRQPADDVANYLQPWSQLLQENSGYSPSPLLQDRGGYSSPEEARAAAMLVLPDILRYDRTQLAHYPNGRVPTDDVYSLRWAWLSNGKIPPTGLKPHDDLLVEFPFLGPPNPYN